MEHFNYKAYITLYHDFPADFRDSLFFPSVAGEKTFEAAISPYGDPFENKTGAFTSEEEARITYNEYVNPAQTLLTVSIADPKGRAFPAYPEGISRRIDNLRRVTLIRVEVNGIYGEVARSDVFFFNVTAANVIYNGEEAPTSMQSAAIAYVVEPNVWASALARDTVFYTGAAASAGLNALSVKGGTVRAATAAQLNAIAAGSPYSHPLAGAVAARVKGVGRGDGAARYRIKFFDDGGAVRSSFFAIMCCTMTKKSGTTTAGKAIFCQYNFAPEALHAYINGFLQAKEAGIATSDGGEDRYVLTIDNVYIIPFSFFGLSNGEEVPAAWISADTWDIYTDPSQEKGTANYSARRMFGGFVYPTAGEVRRFVHASDKQKSVVEQFGAGLASRCVTVGTVFNRITAPQTFYDDSITAFSAFTELFVDSYSADIKVYLNAFGERVEITNDFELPVILSTDTQALAQQKIARTVSIIQSISGTAVAGATIAAGVSTGNPVAVLGGAATLAGQVGNIAQRTTEQIKPTVSSTGSGAGTLNAFTFDGLFYEVSSFQNSEAINADIIANGYEAEIHIIETTGGAGFELFNDQAETDFLAVQNARISAGAISPEAAEFIKARLENGVKIIKTFDELKKHIGV